MSNVNRGQQMFNTLTDKCIVLDLDLTLVSTQDSMDKYYEYNIAFGTDANTFAIRSRSYLLNADDMLKPGAGTIYNFWGVKRPYTTDFLLFCFRYFRLVTVWSAGTRRYVDELVMNLFANIPQPHLVFSRDETDMTNGVPIKDLTRMINYNDFTRKYMTLENTLALDDNPNTFSKNIGNGILIPQYEPRTKEQMASFTDTALLQFSNWLAKPEIMSSVDVRLLPKNNIFLLK